MTGCSREMLLGLVEKKLSLNKKLEVFDHLDRCRDCRDMVHRISRERDGFLFIQERVGKQISVA
ncbi:MAG TPA: hypothetical protein VE398_10745 [Acidobacteriota bacterium]|nr:hypothetical protein [Acidobacteriota bacterium]